MGRLECRVRMTLALSMGLLMLDQTALLAGLISAICGLLLLLVVLVYCYMKDPTPRPE